MKSLFLITMYLIKHHTKDTYGGVEAELHVHLTSVLDRGEWSAFTPGERDPVPTG